MAVGLDRQGYHVAGVTLPPRGRGVYAGPQAAVVVVEAPGAIRAAASVGSCRGLPVGGSGLFTCDLGTLAVGAAAQVAFVLKVTAHSGTISGGVNVRAGTDDPNLANNSSAFSTTVVGKPNPIP